MARSEAPALAKAVGNSYPLRLPPPRQSSTLHRASSYPAGTGYTSQRRSFDTGSSKPRRTWACPDSLPPATVTTTRRVARSDGLLVSSCWAQICRSTPARSCTGTGGSGLRARPVGVVWSGSLSFPVGRARSIEVHPAFAGALTAWSAHSGRLQRTAGAVRTIRGQLDPSLPADQQVRGAALIVGVAANNALPPPQAVRLQPAGPAVAAHWLRPCAPSPPGPAPSRRDRFRETPAQQDPATTAVVESSPTVGASRSAGMNRHPRDADRTRRGPERADPVRDHRDERRGGRETVAGTARGRPRLVSDSGVVRARRARYVARNERCTPRPSTPRRST